MTIINKKITTTLIIGEIKEGPDVLKAHNPESTGRISPKHWKKFIK